MMSQVSVNQGNAAQTVSILAFSGTEYDVLYGVSYSPREVDSSDTLTIKKVKVVHTD